MDRDLQGQRRYLAAVHAAAAVAPARHANQLVALDRERALAAATDDVISYRQASGDLHELARSLQIDRLIGQARIAAAVDDPWRVAACRIELDHALTADDPGAWIAAIAAGGEASAALRARGAVACGAYTSLACAVTRVRADARPGDQTQAVLDAAAARHILRASDPDFDAHAPAARYQLRVPWTDDAAAALGRWIAALDALPAGYGDPDPPSEPCPPAPDAARELAAIDAAIAAWRTRLATRAPIAIGGHEPTVADVIGPYAALTTLPGDDPTLAALREAARALVAAASGAATPQDALATVVEGGHDVAIARAPLAATIAGLRERARSWPDPLLVHHADALARDVARATSPTDLDLIVAHADACFAVEADWVRILAGGLLAPLRAVFIADWDHQPGAAPSIALAWHAVHELAGAGADLLDHPWVAGFVDGMIAGHAGRDSVRGLHHGEVGGETISDARAAFAIASRGQPVALDAARVRDHVRARWGEPPPAAPRELALWGQRFALHAIADALQGRSRPELP